MPLPLSSRQFANNILVGLYQPLEADLYCSLPTNQLLVQPEVKEIKMDEDFLKTMWHE
jgi:hypothetical protein